MICTVWEMCLNSVSGVSFWRAKVIARWGFAQRLA